MSSAICTIFEGHYHYGVAALVNSLCKQGYCGDIYAGYRGSLPKWSESNHTIINDHLWAGSSTVIISESVNLHFVPVDTNYHLTNYKAIFMLKLWNEVIKDASGLFYFDPDIIVRCRWSFYETWITNGVALVHEIVNNDMPLTHPIRKEWEKVIKANNKTVNNKIHSYINGGFCGVSKQDIHFIQTWADIINCGIHVYHADPTKFSSFDRTYPFWSIDQDALNITAMCADCDVSEMGPDGMDFTYGGWTMSHATGTPKPWKKNYILTALKGRGLTITDKHFWLTMAIPAPIQLYSASHIKWKLFTIKVAKFIHRIYRRG